MTTTMRPKSDLRVYQQRVVSYLYERDEAFAILKIGAGKTASTLTAIDEMINDQVIRHGLILAPKRVATLTWPDEIGKWQHLAGMEYAVLDGTPARRAGLLATAADRDLTIVGIDNAQWLCDELARLPDGHPIFDLLVIDETSRLKDPKSKRANALSKIAGRFRIRWGLTGTPRPNSAMDLFTPAKVITNGRLWGKSFYQWQRRNFYPTDFKGYTWLPLPGAEDRIHADMASISITLGEGDMPDLPPLSILVDEVTLPDAARAAYRDMERKLLARLDSRDIVAMSAAVATGKLAQMANGFVYGEGGNADAEALHTAKADWLDDLVASLDGEPLLLIYEYREDLAMIRRLFGHVPYLGAGVSDADARQRVDDWNAGKLPLFALHPAAAGHGINLQHGGSRMAWISPCWSAELWDQTIGRLHRPGQAAAHVMVHVCNATNTVDDLKRSRVISKLSAQAAFENYLAAAGVPGSSRAA